MVPIVLGAVALGRLAAMAVGRRTAGKLATRVEKGADVIEAAVAAAAGLEYAKRAFEADEPRVEDAAESLRASLARMGDLQSTEYSGLAFFESVQRASQVLADTTRLEADVAARRHREEALSSLYPNMYDPVDLERPFIAHARNLEVLRRESAAKHEHEGLVSKLDEDEALVAEARAKLKSQDQAIIARIGSLDVNQALGATDRVTSASPARTPSVAQTREQVLQRQRQNTVQTAHAAALDVTKGSLERLAPIQTQDVALTQSRQQACVELTDAMDRQTESRERNVASLVKEQEVTPSGEDKKAGGIAGGIEAYLAGTGDLAKQTADSTTRVMAALENQFVNVFARGKFDARAFGDVVIDELTRIMAKQAMMTLFGGQGGLAGGGGGGGSSLGGLLGTLVNTGLSWLLGSTQSAPSVSMVGSTANGSAAASFLGAQKFHTGGVIGAGEVPIIANYGEGVFTPAQMSSLAPASALQPIIVNQTVHVDARADSSAIRQGMLIAKNEAIREISNQFQRDGAMRRVAN